MAKGIISPRGMKPGKLLSGTVIENTPSKAFRGTPERLDALIPQVKGDPIEGMPNGDFGTGKITAPKGNAGIIRPTTKPKKG